MDILARVNFIIIIIFLSCGGLDPVVQSQYLCCAVVIIICPLIVIPLDIKIHVFQKNEMNNQNENQLSNHIHKFGLPVMPYEDDFGKYLFHKSFIQCCLWNCQQATVQFKMLIELSCMLLKPTFSRWTFTNFFHVDFSNKLFPAIIYEKKHRTKQREP